MQTRQYGSVIAACGHHWDPLWPELKGDFTGTMMHAHAYRSPKPFEGKNVVIIGAGNSGEHSVLIYSKPCPQSQLAM